MPPSPTAAEAVLSGSSDPRPPEAEETPQKLVLPLTYAVEAAVPQTPASVYLSALPPHHPHYALPASSSSASPFPPTLRPPTPATADPSAGDSYFSLTIRSTPNPTSPGGIYEHLVCPLCFTLPHRMKLLPCCGNRICAECAAQWVKTHPSCPFCRADLDRIANASVTSFKQEMEGVEGVGPVAHEVIHISNDDGSTEESTTEEQANPPAGTTAVAPSVPSAHPLALTDSSPDQPAGDLLSPPSSLPTASEHPSSTTLIEQDPSAAPQPPQPRKKRRRRIMLPDDPNMQAALDDIPVLCPFADAGEDELCGVEWAGGCRWKGRKASVRKHLEADCVGILDPITQTRKIDPADIHFLGVDSYPSKPEDEFLSDSEDESPNGLLDLRLPAFVVADHDPNAPPPAISLWASPVRMCALFSTALVILTMIVLLIIQRKSDPSMYPSTYSFAPNGTSG
ncbi:hypothetical protein BDZ88DRAFT_431648 [Geranomyces variabilis]|nr:hypothetical protein BDZ88DRAFT_431648 [Geranomyces variabilis]KAJ3131865.1 hypothetical protein HDU90_007694 [Geranomyces variabilis]